MGEGTAVDTGILDAFLPEHDIEEQGEIDVAAPAAYTYCAITDADLRDPIMGLLFTFPAYPKRLARRLAGLTAEPRPGPVSFGRITAARRGWTRLAEEPGKALVLGLVSRFWRADRPTRPVEPAEFRRFSEPGWAKVALAFTVEPLSDNRSRLRYEARAAGTDDVARAHLRRHWRVIRPGVVTALARALGRIRTEAEWNECLGGALADR